MVPDVTVQSPTVLGPPWGRGTLPVPLVSSGVSLVWTLQSESLLYRKGPSFAFRGPWRGLGRREPGLPSTSKTLLSRN